MSFLPASVRQHFQRLEKSPTGRIVLRAVFWSFAGMFIVRCMGFASNIVVARIVGRTSLGELGVVHNTVSLFAMFGGLALGLTATRYIAELKESNRERTGRIIALSSFVALGAGALAGLALWLGSPWLASVSLNRPELDGLLQIGAIRLVFSALNGAQSGILGGFEAFKTIAGRSTISALLGVPLTIAGALLDGVRGVLWAQLVNELINVLLFQFSVRHEMRKHGIRYVTHDCAGEFNLLWRFSLPALAGGLLYSPVIWASQAFLAHQPRGYEHLGIYTASFAMQGALQWIGSSVAAPLLPIMVNDRSRSATGRAAVERVNILLNWGLGLIPAIPLLCFPEIINLIYGAQFKGLELQHAFVFTLLSTCLFLQNQGFARLLQKHNLMWWGFLSNAFWGAILLIGAWHLVRYGAVGLAAAGAIAYMLNTLVLVPCFALKKLVPKGTVVSKEAAIIWLAALTAALLSLSEARLSVRGAAFPACMGLVVLCFWRLVRRPVAEPAPAGQS